MGSFALCLAGSTQSTLEQCTVLVTKKKFNSCPPKMCVFVTSEERRVPSSERVNGCAGVLSALARRQGAPNGGVRGVHSSNPACAYTGCSTAEREQIVRMTRTSLAWKRPPYEEMTKRSHAPTALHKKKCRDRIPRNKKTRRFHQLAPCRVLYNDAKTIACSGNTDVAIVFCPGSIDG